MACFLDSIAVNYAGTDIVSVIAVDSSSKNLSKETSGVTGYWLENDFVWEVKRGWCGDSSVLRSSDLWRNRWQVKCPHPDQMLVTAPYDVPVIIRKTSTPLPYGVRGRVISEDVDPISIRRKFKRFRIPYIRMILRREIFTFEQQYFFVSAGPTVLKNIAEHQATKLTWTCCPPNQRHPSDAHHPRIDADLNRWGRTQLGRGMGDYF